MQFIFWGGGGNKMYYGNGENSEWSLAKQGSSVLFSDSAQSFSNNGTRVDSYMKRTGMLVENFEKKP